jgi:ABC-2 type transport system permease protein
VYEIKKVPTVVRYELLKQVRRFRLYGLLLIGSVVIGIAMAVFAIYLRDIGTNARLFSYFVVSVGQISFFGLIAGVFFSGDAIASEFEQKTGYMIFPNPIKRVTLLIGKYLSCCLAATLVISVLYLIISIGVVVIFGQFPVELLYSYLSAVLYTWSVVSLTFIFSSLFKGAMGASVLPFVLVFFVFSIVTAVMEVVGIEPFMLLSYGSGIIGNVLLVPYPAHETQIPIPGANMVVTMFSATIAEGVLVIAAYLVVGLIISAFLIRRRQMA